MRILYITTLDPRAQGDYQEVMILNGLRSILGNSCIDFPKKKVMYRDFSETPQKELHGSGFTLYTLPISEIKDEIRNLENIDFVIYGVTNAYGITDYPEINNLSKNVWYLDGHDHEHITKKPCFKRELFAKEEGVFPTGFGIPHYQIRPINLSEKSQLFQKTAPYHSTFKPATDLGTRYHHIFESEEEYYNDMSRSWFGLTSKKGGWDSLRHYEIMASGSLLLFRDYDSKPELCSPQKLPCFSYSTPDEVNKIMSRLLVDGKPTDEYLDMLFRQREWLLKYGTTEARALEILKVLNQNKIK
jgi:hypothetical protein